MPIPEQAIQNAMDAIHSGTRFDKYIENYGGPENKGALALAVRCKFIEEFSDEDILAYIAHIEAHISGMSSPQKDNHQTVLDALNAEKTTRGI